MYKQYDKKLEVYLANNKYHKAYSKLALKSYKPVSFKPLYFNHNDLNYNVNISSSSVLTHPSAIASKSILNREHIFDHNNNSNNSNNCSNNQTKEFQRKFYFIFIKI